MKKKLWKNGKPYSQFRVVFYSSEDGINRFCSNACNTSDCAGAPPLPDGVNNRCNPPESTIPGANNTRCNLTAFC